MDAIYYESHVALEPVFEERLERLQTLTTKHQFKVADLLMQRRPTDSPERSAKHSFCTGRGKTFEELKNRMETMVFELREDGFKIWRQKIEAVVYDERSKA